MRVSVNHVDHELSVFDGTNLGDLQSSCLRGNCPLFRQLMHVLGTGARARARVCVRAYRVQQLKLILMLKSTKKAELSWISYNNALELAIVFLS